MNKEEICVSDISAFIKAKRKELGIGQVELSKTAKVTQQCISFYENGKVNPKPKTIVKMLAALGYRVTGHGNGPGMLIIEEIPEERRDELLRHYQNS